MLLVTEKGHGTEKGAWNRKRGMDNWLEAIVQERVPARIQIVANKVAVGNAKCLIFCCSHN